jgi:hypothetical protein
MSARARLQDKNVKATLKMMEDMIKKKEAMKCPVSLFLCVLEFIVLLCLL